MSDSIAFWNDSYVESKTAYTIWMEFEAEGFDNKYCYSVDFYDINNDIGLILI